MASLTEMTAGTDAAHPVRSVVLLMILAAILKSQLLLPALAILLGDSSTLHFLTHLGGLSIHL